MNRTKLPDSVREWIEATGNEGWNLDLNNTFDKLKKLLETKILLLNSLKSLQIDKKIGLEEKWFFSRGELNFKIKEAFDNFIENKKKELKTKQSELETKSKSKLWTKKAEREAKVEELIKEIEKITNEIADLRETKEVVVDFEKTYWENIGPNSSLNYGLGFFTERIRIELAKKRGELGSAINQIISTLKVDNDLAEQLRELKNRLEGLEGLLQKQIEKMDHQLGEEAQILLWKSQQHENFSILSEPKKLSKIVEEIKGEVGLVRPAPPPRSKTTNGVLESSKKEEMSSPSKMGKRRKTLSGGEGEKALRQSVVDWEDWKLKSCPKEQLSIVRGEFENKAVNWKKILEDLQSWRKEFEDSDKTMFKKNMKKDLEQANNTSYKELKAQIEAADNINKLEEILGRVRTGESLGFKDYEMNEIMACFEEKFISLQNQKIFFLTERIEETEDKIGDIINDKDTALEELGEKTKEITELKVKLGKQERWEKDKKDWEDLEAELAAAKEQITNLTATNSDHEKNMNQAVSKWEKNADEFLSDIGDKERQLTEKQGEIERLNKVITGEQQEILNYKGGEEESIKIIEGLREELNWAKKKYQDLEAEIAKALQSSDNFLQAVDKFTRRRGKKWINEEIRKAEEARVREGKLVNLFNIIKKWEEKMKRLEVENEALWSEWEKQVENNLLTKDGDLISAPSGESLAGYIPIHEPENSPSAEDQLHNLTSQNEGLRKEIEDKNRELEEARKKEQELIKTIKEKEAQISRLQKLGKGSESIVAKQKEEITRLKAEITDLENQLGIAKSDSADKNSSLKRLRLLETSVEDGEEVIESLNDDIEDLQKDITNEQELNRDLGEKISELENQLENLKTENKELTDRLEQKNRELKSQVEEESQSNMEVPPTFDEVEMDDIVQRDVGAYQSYINDLKDEIQYWLNEEVQREEELESLGVEHDKEISYYEFKINQLGVQVNQLSASLSRESWENNWLNQNIWGLQQELARVTELCRQLEATGFSYYTTASKQIAELQTLIKTKDERISRLNQLNIKTGSNLGQALTEKDLLAQQVQELEIEKKALEDKLGEKRGKIIAGQVEIKKLIREKAAHQKAAEHGVLGMRKLHWGLKNAQQVIKTLEVEKKGLEKDKENIREEKKEYRRKLNAILKAQKSQKQKAEMANLCRDLIVYARDESLDKAGDDELEITINKSTDNLIKVIDQTQNHLGISDLTRITDIEMPDDKSLSDLITFYEKNKDNSPTPSTQTIIELGESNETVIVNTIVQECDLGLSENSTLTQVINRIKKLIKTKPKPVFQSVFKNDTPFGESLEKIIQIDLHSLEKELKINLSRTVKEQIKKATNYQELNFLRNKEIKSYLEKGQGSGITSQPSKELIRPLERERILWLVLLAISIILIGGLLLKIKKIKRSKE